MPARNHIAPFAHFRNRRASPAWVGAPWYFTYVAPDYAHPGFKIAHGRLGKQLRTARARVAQLFEQRRGVPKRVEVRDLNERAVVKLATERKHLTDIIKMVAYQAESDLLALLRPHYARADQ
ncbi:MAG: hypothetical protein WBW73_15655, partial [Rhodoplanes sp.]